LKPALVYSPAYDLKLFGLEKLHPFDGRKFSRAWALVERRLGRELASVARRPDAEVSDQDLLRVHTPAYLESLRSSSAVAARALEMRGLRLLPRGLVARRILSPMRLAVAGTILAVQQALSGDGAVAMNLGGGFHHAFRDHGEGFCIYADVAVAIAVARARGLLAAADAVAVIDLDAHRGNGFWDACGDDPAVHVFDLYNFQAYPGLFPGDADAHPFQIPLKAGTGDRAYLDTVREELPKFFAAIPRPRVAVYNAGTDIVEGDRVGRLAVSADGVRERDRLVLAALIERGIPAVIVTSGGYSQHSHKLIADLAVALVERLRS